MTPSVGKKLSLFVATMVLLAVGTVGYVSHAFIEARFAEILRKDTLDAATLLASRVRNELRHVAEKGRILSAAALEEFKNPDDQIRFLEDNLAIDDQFVALSLYRKSVNSTSGNWGTVFRITRPDTDPTHLEEEDFTDLDLKYPIDLSLVAEGAVEVSVGTLKDGTPILRMAVPIVRKQGHGFTQILGIEVRQERITAAFAEATAHFSFVLDRSGRVLAQTDPTHFSLGEDVSHLPILQMAKSTDAPNGNLDYYELPGGMLQYGSFHKVGYADLSVVSQAPRTHVIKMLRAYTRQAGMLGIAFVFIAMAFALVAAWGIVGGRLGRLSSAIRRVGDGHFSVNFPDTHTGDEVGDFARKLQAVCDELKAREKNHASYTKLRTRRVRSRLNEGKIGFLGERSKAFALHLRLSGLEAISAQADPEHLLKLLNRFNEKVITSVEGHHGIVDHIMAGTIIAYWGTPVSDPTDTDEALMSCLEIKRYVKSLNNSLKVARLPELTLAMGLHYGPVIAGQIGSPERLEYTTLGEAVEVAARIQSMTEQFGTDFLLTSQAISQAPKWYNLEKVSGSEGGGPELYELLGTTKRRQIEDTAEDAKEDAKEEAKEESEETMQASSSTDAEESQAEGEAAASSEAASEPVKKKRGRPRKHKAAEVEQTDTSSEPTAAAEQTEPSFDQVEDPEKAA